LQSPFKGFIAQSPFNRSNSGINSARDGTCSDLSQHNIHGTANIEEVHKKDATPKRRGKLTQSVIHSIHGIFFHDHPNESEVDGANKKNGTDKENLEHAVRNSNLWL
jgi:hypothetical protein